MKNNTLQSLLYIVGVLALATLAVFVLRDCSIRIRNHNLIQADLLQDAQGKEYMLVHYSYMTTGKGPTYYYNVLQSFDPISGEKIGEYAHSYKSSRGSFSVIYQNEKFLYFAGKEYEPYCVSLPNLEEVANPEKINQEILAKNPKIKDIFELKVMDGVFKVNTTDAYTYWISPENMQVISESEALSIRNSPSDKHIKYTIGKIWKDFEKYQEREKWISLASGHKPKQNNKLITIDTLRNIEPSEIASKFAFNYAVVDTHTYRSFVLEGELRRHFLEILPEGKVKKLTPETTYIKGILLRPYQEKGQFPNRKWAIITAKPLATFVFHQSEMHEEKASFLLNKVNIETGEDLWKINLTELCKISSKDYPQYSWLVGNTLICIFEGRTRNKMLCLSTKDGALKWQVEI